MEYKLKSTVLEVGLGFGLGKLIIAVLAKDHDGFWLARHEELLREHWRKKEGIPLMEVKLERNQEAPSFCL